MNDRRSLQSEAINSAPAKQRNPLDLLLWTVSDLQSVSGWSRRQAYQMVNSAGFPAIRLNGGKRIMIPRDAFFRWLDAQTEQAAG